MIYLSALFILDELPHLSFVPWKASLNSILKFVDEVIVVHGGKRDNMGCRPALDYIHSLDDQRIKVVIFNWPEIFDWTQIARTCTFGQLHASGEWVFRVLIDEVFTENFVHAGDMLRALPQNVSIASVDRYYLLGSRFAFPYREKPIFIRQGSGFGYGMISAEQGVEAMPRMFDDPIDLRHWYEGGKVCEITGPTLLEAPDAKERIMKGEVPKGYRDLTGKVQARLPLAFLNTDVSFLSDEMIVEQKKLSAYGYARLPAPYCTDQYLSEENLLPGVMMKVERMLASRDLLEVDAPDDLLRFFDEHDGVRNCIRTLCEEAYGLPWNRVSRQMNLKGKIRAAERAARMLFRHFIQR